MWHLNLLSFEVMPKGCYGYGLLLERRGDLASARQQIEQVIFSVRNSHHFHRRRNRHWMWKAKGWLWRHPKTDTSQSVAEQVK